MFLWEELRLGSEQLLVIFLYYTYLKVDMAKHHRRRVPSKRSHSHHRTSRRNSNSGITFHKFQKFILRHQIISSLGSIILSIVLIRISFSNTLFGANITEFRMWFIFFAILLGIIGVISLSVWFRRNVPQMFTKHNVNWRNR